MTPDELFEERKRRGAIYLRIRNSRQITLMQMSRLTGLTRQTIRRIESGCAAWNIDTEIILMRTLQINQVDGNIELCHEGGKITSLKISGVNLISRVVS